MARTPNTLAPFQFMTFPPPPSILISSSCLSGCKSNNNNKNVLNHVNKINSHNIKKKNLLSE